MKRKFFKLFVVAQFIGLICLINQATTVFGEVAKGDFGIGVNYPGIGARYFLTDKIPAELRMQFGSGITVIGARGYYYFNRDISKVLIFTGSGLHFVSFKGEESDGTGFIVELYGGGEYFFNKNFSILLDLGPAIISLQDKDYSASASGVEFVVNIGFNYYFGK